MPKRQVSKHWWLSKTEWAAILAGVAVIIQAITGQQWLTAEAQVGILAGIMFVLRFFTNQPIGK